MNRKQFLTEVEQRLSPLPAEVRNELLSDLSQHFDYGLVNGKSESEIANELGNPEDIAREALDDPNAAWNASPPLRQGSFARNLFTFLGLLFLNLLISIPIMATLWVVWVSLTVVAASFIAAPLLAVTDYALNSTFYPAKFFFSITLTGTGLLLLPGVRYLLLLMVKGTVRYWKWNQTTLRGAY
ncbi:DUF1700 domain-containing protein [Paenibacillus polymyxa]|uniref:DUF1700 domain-containing protein n=1 Tax=Paenibacillus polymyxa TaxID=1406 RepID=UPI0020253627|nr:DUF1700 domain-containing protein [Paenibacillus polymyxa]WDZ63296.1 DUF1700 domain-containing protein [Paenibacillus polymyxa]